MRLPILAAMILMAGCSQGAPSPGDALAQPRRRPAFAEEPLRLEGTAVRIRQEGSKVTFSIANRTGVDLCIARHEWVGETQEATRVYGPDGREFAYRGELSPVTDDARPPIGVTAGETLRQEEDLARSYQVEDWTRARVVYAPLVSLCRGP